MELPFIKYHGSGNDFILIDNRSGKFSSINSQIIKSLCHRNFGIGSDGILFLDPSVGGIFQMRFYNPDGSEPGICGNGLCCFLHYLHSNIEQKKQYQISCKSKLYLGHIQDNKVVIEMDHVRTLKEPFVQEIEGRSYQACQIFAGVPHLLIMVEDVDKIEVNRIGRLLRSHPDYQPEGTNVSFLQFMDDVLEVRTYERGVEAETLCCGSACISSGYFAIAHLGKNGSISILPKSREKIAINVGSSHNKVEMKAQATPVFFGVASINSNG